jgi:molybdenum cofactor cytidylyltransferase
MKITALILAAGQSKRMGRPKMLLPWGNTTVLGQILQTLTHANISHILVVTGAARSDIEKISAAFEALVAHNPDYAHAEMLSSLQTGLHALRERTSAEAALIVLGDQPQVQEGSVRAVVRRFIETGASLIVPSYQMRRGHPWLVARPLWDEILQMKSPQSPRDFLNRHASEIEYVDVDSPSILADLDTYGDYLKSRPERAIVEVSKEADMSDLTLMAEAIRDTIETMERAREVSRELRDNTNHENYSAFRTQMDELSERLRKLNARLAHEDEVALDELADALSRAFHGQSTEYRRGDEHA